MIYKLIGRAVVKIATISIKKRSSGLTVGAGVAVVVLGIGVYAAARRIEEG